MSSSDYLLDISREYSLYVCETRAIPRVQDGMKHGQRMIHWILRNRTEKLKTFALSGLLGFERLYVHGETSANNTIGLMAAPFKNNTPLIEGLGQFGSRVAPVDGIGAPRYTEVRRAKAAELILYRDLDLIPLEDNYDGSNQQPRHFLPLIPTVLLNGVSGIAVGHSTEILPRALKGLVQATQDALDGAETLRGLEPHFERYDVKVRPLAANQYEFSGKAVIEDTSTVRIVELPPGLSVENFRKRLIQMEDDEAIAGFTDRSAEVIDISVRFKRGSIKGWTRDQAIAFFKLKEKTTERIVVIDWDGHAIRTYADPQQLVRDFVAWRLAWYARRYDKMLADTRRERNFWSLIKLLFESGFAKKLGTFPDRAAMAAEVVALVQKNRQALGGGDLDRVLGLPTYRWTREFEAEVADKLAGLDAQIAEQAAVLGSPARLKAIYLSELGELAKLK